MAITNAQIVDNAKRQLYAEGVLKGTGRMLEFQDAEGKTIYLPEVEDIHTFQVWKQMGYSVRKGEHAIARFSIWKYSAGKKMTDDDADPENTGRGHCFLKEACWFSASQVEAQA